MLQITLLGPPQIILGGEPIRSLSSAKSQALLYYLAVRGRPESRLTLAGLLWPDKNDTEARTNLRQAVRQLRQLLGDASEGGYLVTLRDSIALNETLSISVDAPLFEWTANAGLAGDMQVLQSAVDQYTGEFLSGFYVDDASGYEDWMLMIRERLRGLVLQSLHTLADHYTAHHEVKPGLRIARQFLEIEPWREEAHRMLMQFLAWDGQTSAALAQYDRCRQVLLQEFGTEPNPETQALYNAIRTNLVPRKNLPVATQPTRVKFPSNLPPQPSPFIGRASEITHLTRLLSPFSPPPSPLLTLHGPGGVGKTRLALQLADALVDQFPDGVWLVELAPLTDELEIPEAILQAINLQPDGSRSLAQTVHDYFRQKRSLLILDNCEHLGKAPAQWADSLRDHAPGLSLLATSRIPLRARDEQVIQVHPLTTPQPNGGSPLTAANLLKYEAVQLFTARLAQASSGFALNAKNAEAVATICNQLDGIPLALEIAAARARVMPLERLAQRLEQRLHWVHNTLSPEESAAARRQQTLQALMDWSYDLLRPEEATLFNRLAVFAGGWTLDATEAMFEDDGLDILIELVEQSLVIFGYDPARSRYRMHEIIRQYASEKLQASGETPDMVARHARYYAHLVAQTAQNAKNQPLQERLDLMDQEHANIRAALEWLVTHDPEQALSLAADLGKELRFWELRGHHEEGRRELSRTLEASPLPSKARARALLAAAALSSAITDFEYGQACTQESLTIFRQLDDIPGEIDAIMTSAQLSIHQGQFTGLVETVTEAMTQAEKAQDLNGLAWGHDILGQIFDEVGENEQATTHLLQSVALRRQLDDPYELANSLNSLAVLLMGQKTYLEASEVLQEAVSLNLALGYRRGVALALHNLAECAMELGNYARAKTLNTESLRIRRELGLRRGYAYSLENFASLAARENQFPRAVQLFAASQALREQMGSPTSIYNQTVQNKYLENAKTHLGAIRYDLEWAKGWSLSADQAVELALS